MLILASESPRRRELLLRLGVPFVCVPAAVEELTQGGEGELKLLPEKNALLKARKVAESFPGDFVLGADTGVFAAGKMLGKPRSESEAAAMLELLQGGSHEVISGVALICREKALALSWSVASTVTMGPLSAEEIARYMEKVDVLDKAGAYGIQEHPELLKAVCRGETENVMGLPLLKLKEVFVRCGLVREG